MTADYIFRMGKTHTICQDYALAGRTSKCQYAILSDGCSGIPNPNQPGSPYTDLGARFLTLSAKKYIDELADGFFRKESIITEAAAMARQASLPSDALDATLLAVAIADESRYGHVFYHGDGVLAFREKNGDLRYITWKFGNNMPYYLSCTRSFEREQRYLDEAKTVEVTTGNRTQGIWTRYQTEKPIETQQHQIPFDSQRDDIVLLLSDGADSFVNSSGDSLALETVLDEMFAIKSYPGQFIQRRVGRFLSKFCVEMVGPIQTTSRYVVSTWGSPEHVDQAPNGLRLGNSLPGREEPGLWRVLLKKACFDVQRRRPMSYPMARRHRRDGDHRQQ